MYNAELGKKHVVTDRLHTLVLGLQFSAKTFKKVLVDM